MVHSDNRNTSNPVTVKLKGADIFQEFCFQMACILQPECNFLHGFFRCRLPVEKVDVEVGITSMQGTHMFRRDRICQVIKCNPWSTRLCPHPTIIKNMKTYHELERKLGPKLQTQSNQFRPTQPDTNPCVRKETKATKKRKWLIPTKKYEMKVVARHNANTATTQPLITVPKTPITPEGQKPLLENTLENSAGTPWPEAGKISGNLF